MSRFPIEIEGPTIVADENNVQIGMFKVNYIKTPILCRPVDEWLLKSIFKDREYALPPLNNFFPKLILDCGGNIGTSAVFFANVYPTAKIIVIEPDEVNFQMLQMNTSLYPNVECIRSAVWACETYIDLSGNYPAGYKAFETEKDNPRAIKSTTISTLLANSGFDGIDLLKIDVEGSEKEIFEAPDVHDWLSVTKVLAIEVHDRYKRGCSRAVFKAVADHNFYFTLNGENLIFIREDILDQ